MNSIIYPRAHDKQTVYLKSVIKGANIEVGDYTIYNDFVSDPRDFEKNNGIGGITDELYSDHKRKY